MLYTRYCYGGGVRARNVARMEKWEDLVEHISVQLKVSMYMEKESFDSVCEIVYCSLERLDS